MAWRWALLGILVMIQGNSVDSRADGLTIDIRQVQSGPFTAWLVEDHSLPVISFYAMNASGSVLDPEGKSGLATMTVSLLDEGSGTDDSLAYQTKLEDIAAKIRFSLSRDQFAFSVRTLRETYKETFALLAQALTNPRFDADAIERVRAQMLSSLKRDHQSPSVMARRLWYEKAFDGHPYARPAIGRAADLPAITRDDLLAMHRQLLRRDNLSIAVVGAINATEVRDLLAQVFAPLKDIDDPIPVKPIALSRHGVEQVPWDIDQSSVFFGLNGYARGDDDYYALALLNYILGGGSFSARLMREIREKRGLVYGVRSWLEEWKYAPLIVGSLATSNQQVDQALEVLRQEMDDIRQNGVTAAELQDAKDHIIGSLPLQIISTRQLARLLAQLQYDGLGRDYFDKRETLINDVSLDDISRVGQALLDPDKLLITVVGGTNTVGKGDGND